MTEPGRARLAVLISGRGSNMLAIADHAATPGCSYEVVLVASDRPDAPGLTAAAGRGIAVAGLPTPNRATKPDYEAALDARLRAVGAEWIALAGYMRLLSPEFVARWEGRIVNIHPSLLPAYKGLDTHARALAAGDAVHGASVHLVNAALDDGPVLAQAVVPIMAGDTPDTLAARVLEAEHRLYPRAIADLVGAARRADAA